jgi:hypothetical protein
VDGATSSLYVLVMEYNADQKYASIFIVVGLGIVALLTRWQTEKPITKVCFTSSKRYQAHPTSGGADVRDGWSANHSVNASIAPRLQRRRFTNNILMVSMISL